LDDRRGLRECRTTNTNHKLTEEKMKGKDRKEGKERETR